MFPDAQDPRHQTPVFRGYELARKPRRGGGQGLEEDEQPKREDYVAHRKGHPCAVCLVGKPGRCRRGGGGREEGLLMITHVIVIDQSLTSYPNNG